MGVIGFDVQMDIFQRYLLKVNSFSAKSINFQTKGINLNNMSIIFLNENGTILNDPFHYNYSVILQIYDTNYTRILKKKLILYNFTDLTFEHWNIIRNKSTENETFEITNTVNQNFLISRTFLKSFDVSHRFSLKIVK